MDVVELLTELREWVTALNLTKFQVYVYFITSLVFWKIKPILRHRREVAEIKLDFFNKSQKLQNKIEAQKEKRARKLESKRK